MDTGSPPSNDDAQVVLGDVIINGGTVRSFSAIPEPSSLGIGALLLSVLLGLTPRALSMAISVARTHQTISEQDIARFEYMPQSVKKVASSTHLDLTRVSSHR